MANLDLPRAQDLPAWMSKLKDRYLQTETSLFVLHGNVHDAVYCAQRVWSMPRFLSAFFAPSDKVVVHYDPSRGLWFPDHAHAGRAGRSLAASGFLNPSKLGKQGAASSDAAIARSLELEFLGERQPEVALNVLEALLVNDDVSVAAIIHYAEMIAPNGAVSSLGFYERTAAARLHRWSVWEEVAGSDNLVLMLTSAFSELARQVTRNPRVGAISVPLPTALERARFLAHVEPGLDADRGEALTRITAGLQLRQIKDLLSANAAPAPNPDAGDARGLFRGPAPLPVKAIFQRKKEILEQECAGLIEVIEPSHGFEVVGGMDHIKQALMKVAEHVKAGRSRQVPMGVLFVGPMGTGKTFLAEAFARESGLAAIKLKNFRDKWVGSTEANLEKVLTVIEGLGEILVMIDEGDRSIGGAGDSDGGVNSRVMARLKEFMSDTTHRGRIIFVMMTNRPDKLDTDIKRPGRFDLKIPFFPPQNAEERAAILRAVLRRHKIDHELPDDTLLPLLEPLDGYGAADLEAVALMAFDDVQSGFLPRGVSEAATIVTSPYLAQAIHDFMPTRETAMIHFMELLAVQEASNRRMLPPRYAELTVAEINERLADARARVPGPARG